MPANVQASWRVFLLKVGLLLPLLPRPCGNSAPTAEAQKSLMAPRLRSGLLLCDLNGPAAFVLIHPSVRVGRADPSLETPNGLFVVAVFIFLLYPIYLLLSTAFYSSCLYNRCFALIWPFLPITCSPLACCSSPASEGIAPIPGFLSCFQCCSLQSCVPHGLRRIFAALVLFKLHSADCSIGGAALSFERHSSFTLKREPALLLAS